MCSQLFVSQMRVSDVYLFQFVLLGKRRVRDALSALTIPILCLIYNMYSSFNLLLNENCVVHIHCAYSKNTTFGCQTVRDARFVCCVLDARHIYACFVIAHRVVYYTQITFEYSVVVGQTRWR